MMKRRHRALVTGVLVFVLTACFFTQKKEAPKQEKDIVMMIRVNGKIYVYDSAATIEPTCGVADGILTSTVEPSGTPQEDDQSNFGSGYQYQFYKENSILVFMDKLKVFRYEPLENK